MKKFLKLSLVFSVLALIFAGCSRDSENGENSTGYIRFKLNGEQRDYSYPIAENEPPIAAVLHFDKSQNRYYQLEVKGYQKAKKSNTYSPETEIYPEISIYLRVVKATNTKITEGVYTIENTTFGDNYNLSCTHSIGLSDVYTNFGGNFTLKIEKLTQTHAKGTFSGVLKKEGGSQTYAITDGEFSLNVDYRETEQK